MNPRTTGILLLIAAALGAFVYFYEIQGEEGRSESEALEKRLIPGVEGENVEWIEFQTTDDRAVRLERRGEEWRLTQPLDFPADRFAADGMASNLAELTSESVFEDPQPLAEYGLDDDDRRVRFGAGEAEHAVRFGNDTPVGANSYASIDGEDEVYTVASSLATSFQKSLFDLRDKRIFQFETDTIRHVEARWPGGRVVLERVDAEADDADTGDTAGTTDTRWRLTAPVEGPADDEAVDGLLSELAFLRATGFVDEPLSDAEAGLDEPAFAVVLSGAEAEGADAARYSVSVSPAREGRVLLRAAGTTLYSFAPERLNDFPRELIDYRYKQLAEFPVTDARQVELFFQPEVGDPVAITAMRDDEGWSASPESVAPGKLPRLVSELSRLRAEDILADSLGEEELAALGLSPPNTIITVLGEVPVAEGDEAAASAPKLAEIHIGVVENGESIVARAAGNPAVYRLSYELAEHVPVNLEAFLNRFRSEEVEAEEPPVAPEGDDFLSNTEESP